MRNTRHKSLCFIPYLLWLGVPVPRCARGSGNTRKCAVIVRELRGKMLLLDSYPVAHMSQLNAPYLLHPIFYELGHFRAGLLCWQLRRQLHQQLCRTIAPAEKGDQSRRASGGFPLGWIHELRTPD